MTVDSFVPLIVVSLLLAAVTAAAYAVQVSRLARLRRDLGDRLRLVESDLGVICAAQREVGERVVSLDERTRKVAGDQSRLGARPASESGYRQAITLAARGASAEELVQICGLSESEAALLLSVHRNGPGDIASA